MSFLAAIPILGQLFERTLGIVDQVVTDKDRLNEIKFNLAQMQTLLNQAEAGSTNLFISGWRPAVGWLGVLGLLYVTVFYPFLTWLSTNMGWVSPPQMETDMLLSLLFGMLGFGGFRTYEKINGVVDKH